MKAFTLTLKLQLVIFAILGVCGLASSYYFANKKNQRQLASVETPASSDYRITASSSFANFGPEHAFDKNLQTAWCAATVADDSNKIKNRNFKTIFEDWWQIEFLKTPQTIGAIHMRSGYINQGELQGYKIRDFVWKYQLQDNPRWFEIAETNVYANRSQLIFRFKPIANIVKLGLFIRPRNSGELYFANNNMPCLREVSFYTRTQAKIVTQPWVLTVSSWEQGNRFRPNYIKGYNFFPIEKTLSDFFKEINFDYNHNFITADQIDNLWIGEFHDQPLAAEISKSPPQVLINDQIKSIDALAMASGYPSWILHEPAPSAILYSGNFRDYDWVNPKIYSGFYRFIKDQAPKIPQLGACGGHQLMAMALMNQTYPDFAAEFTADHAAQAVVTCNHISGVECDSEASPSDCCKEGGDANPLRTIVPNQPGLAISNLFNHSRHDLLFNLLPASGFAAYFSHTDTVNHRRLTDGDLELIASYPNNVAKIDTQHPSLVQAMKLKDALFYGTQFHWDEGEGYKLFNNRQGIGYRNMERILKNFLLMALNQFKDPTNFTVSSSTNRAGIENLFDGDRNSKWCATPSPDQPLTVEFNFNQAVSFRSLVAVYERSANGGLPHLSLAVKSADPSATLSAWQPLDLVAMSLFQTQAISHLSCAEASCLPGIEDNESYQYISANPVQTRYLRLTFIPSETGPATTPVCLRELLLPKSN